MSQKELALRIGMSEKHISTVLSGEKKISVSLARKLAIVFEKDYKYWTDLQTEYDNYQLLCEEKNNITPEEKAILKPTKEIFGYLVEERLLHNDCSDVDKVLQFRDFLCVADLTAASKISYNAAYRAQLKGNSAVDANVLFVWQRLCEKLTDRVENVAETLNIDLLISKLGEIRSLINVSEPNVFRMHLQKIFAECGIAFEVVRHFKGAPVQGFIKKAESGRNILCLTIRNGRADIFWFTLFHELGHIVNGDFSMRFVDFPSVDNAVERAADKFASEMLIPTEQFNRFIKNYDYRHLAEIEKFAHKVGIPSFMVIGRLQKMELLDWSAYNDRIPKYKWVDTEE